jgi:hypothetical protein
MELPQLTAADRSNVMCAWNDSNILQRYLDQQTIEVRRWKEGDHGECTKDKEVSQTFTALSLNG